MFDFIGTLTESKLISTTSALKNYSAADLAEIAVLNICALYILSCEKSTQSFAASYAKKTVQNGDFDHWRSNANDLYVILYSLIAEDVELHDQEHSDSFKANMPIHENLLIRWLRDIGAGRHSGAHKNFFTNLDFNFKIKNPSLRAIRRLVMEWEDLDKHDRELAMTRMLQMFRAHARRSELLGPLTKIAHAHDLELDDVCNQETGKGCSAPSHGYENDPNKKKGISPVVAAAAGFATGVGAAKLVHHYTKKKVHEGFDGDEYFDAEQIRQAERQNHKSRSILIWMAPEEFLEVAQDGFDDHKMSGVTDLVQNGVKFNSVPLLSFDHTGEGIATVVGHEGRHRARALAKLGVRKMPVLLTHRFEGNGQSMRWGSMNDEDSFDRFEQKWPQILFGQKPDNGTINRKNIPFPVPDLRNAPKMESASSGATGAASIATAPGAVGGIGVGFDPNGDRGIYQSKKKTTPLIRR
jgi:hypothetical protein